MPAALGNFLHKWGSDARAMGCLVFAVALAIRLLGIGWGLPDANHHWSRHPDEPVIWLYSQQIKPAEGKFTPGFYNYGTLYLTGLRVATDVVNGYGGDPKAQDGSDQPQSMARYHMAGRLISAFAGAGTAWVVLLILWRRTPLIGSIFGSLAVAFAPGLVIHSKFQTVDVLATFLLTLGLYYALKLVPSSTEEVADQKHRFFDSATKFAVLSGLFFGLSAGTKYTGLLGLVALLVVCLATRQIRQAIIGIAVCGLTFLVSTPGILLDSAKFWKDFGYEMAHTSQGHGLVFAGTSSGWIYHLGNLSIGLGTVVLILGVAGMARAAFRKHLWALSLIIFALAFYCLIGRAEVKFMRYTFPLIPVVAVFGGWIVGRAHIHPDKRLRGIVLVGILGLGGLGGGGAAMSMGGAYLMQTTPDPRESVTSLLQMNKELDSATIGLVSDPWFYTPDFYPEAGSPRWVPFAKRDSDMKSFRGRDGLWVGSRLVRYVPENPDERQDWDTRLLDLRPDMVVFSSFETEGLERLEPLTNVTQELQPQTARFKEFIERLQKEYDPLWISEDNVFCAVHDLMYIRPNYYIWKRKKDLKTESSGSSTTSGTSVEQANTH